MLDGVIEAPGMQGKGLDHSTEGSSRVYRGRIRVPRRPIPGMIVTCVTVLTGACLGGFAPRPMCSGAWIQAVMWVLCRTKIGVGGEAIDPVRGAAKPVS